MKHPVIIFGAGPLGRMAKEIFEQNDIVVYGFLDENASEKDKMIDDVAVLGDLYAPEFIRLIGERCDAFVALDDNALRENIIEKLWQERKIKPLNAIHRTALLSPKTSMGYGNFIDANVRLNADAIIGNNCIIGVNSVLGVATQLADGVQIGAGSVLGHGVTIEKNVFLGSGVHIPANIKVEEGARVGMGSVVLKPVAKHETVLGNPARKLDLSKKNIY